MERQGPDEITEAKLTEVVMSGALMTELNPFVLSHHLWGFFQHGLQGEARQVFKAEKRQDGFNIWRVLTLETQFSDRLPTARTADEGPEPSTSRGQPRHQQGIRRLV